MGKRLLDDIARLVRTDRAVGPGERGPRIQLLDHAHDRDACLELALDDGAMHRRGTSILRKQGGMHVDHPKTRDRQEMLGNDPAVGGDDAEIGLPCAQRVGHLGRLQAIGLQHGKMPRDRQRLHRRIGNLLPAAARTVRLGDNTGHGVTGIQQELQRGHREPRRPEEHDHHLPVRDSFLIFLTMRSFCRPRRRSTNSVPSR